MMVYLLKPETFLRLCIAVPQNYPKNDVCCHPEKCVLLQWVSSKTPGLTPLVLEPSNYLPVLCLALTNAIRPSFSQARHEQNTHSMIKQVIEERVGIR